MKKLSDFWVIQVFVLLHVLVALLSRLLGLSDELLLTLLTMLLVVVLCWRRQVGVAVMACMLIIANVGGFFLSKAFGNLLYRFFEWNNIVFGPGIVLAVTEIVAWVVLGLIHLMEKLGLPARKERISVRWLMFAFMTILMVRFVRIFVVSEEHLSSNLGLNVLLDYLFSCGAVFYLAHCSIRAESRAAEEREKAHRAQYDYLKLKQQVEPHFMFNNLNVLDELVSSGNTEAASTFIRKLASTYRYMSGSELEAMVPLRDEMKFVREYVDLLKVRFEDAVDIAADGIPESAMAMFVVPCSVQLLVENAFKHNAASSENPLVVRMRVEGNCLVVSNPLRPRFTLVQASGLGLRYIRQQYRDVAGEDMTVSSDGGEFTVKLPLIYGSTDNRR